MNPKAHPVFRGCFSLDQHVAEAKTWNVTAITTTDGGISATVTKGETYTVTVTGQTLACTCPLWRNVLHRGQFNGRTLIPGPEPTACVHMEALAMAAPDAIRALMLGENAAEHTDNAFHRHLRNVLSEYTTRYVKQIAGAYRQNPNYTPLLIGPSDIGKTYILHEVAVACERRVVEISGAPSWGDAELVGVKTSNHTYRGPLALAFEAAQNGESILLIVDEVRRFPRSAFDILIMALPVLSAAHARAQGIDTDRPIRRVSAPMYGHLWAPADNLRIAMGTNTWGNDLDPAFVRRVHPLPITWDAKFIQSLGVASAIGNFIAHTHSIANQPTSPLGLPVGLSVLFEMKHSNDEQPLFDYLQRIRAFDPLMADALETTARSMGLFKKQEKV